MNKFTKIVAVSLVLLLTLATACGTAKESTLLKEGGNAALQSGPMLGYVDMLEALIWVQAKGPATAQVAYWETGKPATKYWTDVVTTQKEHGYTAKCIADQVQPGLAYTYMVYLNGKAVSRPYPLEFKTQPLWQWRTDPPMVTFAAGSCAYVNEVQYDRPGDGYGSEYGIFQKIHERRPDFMIWLGDNFYYREPDWFTRTGMLHRATHTRSLPEMQPLLASTAHYAIWDDHDYGPNDSDGSFIHKDMAWSVFQDFWGNPSFGTSGQKGCTTMFQYGDVDFFLLDNRYFRTPNECQQCPNRSLLGAEQFDWLCQALSSSRAPFKFVAIGGQVLTTNNSSETCFHYFPEERDRLLAFIEKENIKGVVFLTGDRHFTELSAQKNKAGNWVYDLTTSALTSGAYTNAEREKNELRVPGTLFNKHNFALVTVRGVRKARELEIKICDTNGKDLWTKVIGADGEID
jgi:alkaline phosphatase D